MISGQWSVINVVCCAQLSTIIYHVVSLFLMLFLFMLLLELKEETRKEMKRGRRRDINLGNRTEISF
jgi:hypothetical protein